MVDTFDSIATEALTQTGSVSAVIFVGDVDGGLELVGVAGIRGEPLERLVEAVHSPEHPVTRTAREGQAGFDVTPMAPGGPALRTHIPLPDPNGSMKSLGVLALAHQEPLTPGQRQAAVDLAGRAAGLAAAN